jgi:hypothetical protein
VNRIGRVDGRPWAQIGFTFCSTRDPHGPHFGPTPWRQVRISSFYSYGSWVDLRLELSGSAVVPKPKSHKRFHCICRIVFPLWEMFFCRISVFIAFAELSFLLSPHERSPNVRIHPPDGVGSDEYVGFKIRVAVIAQTLANTCFRFYLPHMFSCCCLIVLFLTGKIVLFISKSVWCYRA